MRRASRKNGLSGRTLPPHTPLLVPAGRRDGGTDHQAASPNFEPTMSSFDTQWCVYVHAVPRCVTAHSSAAWSARTSVSQVAAEAAAITPQARRQTNRQAAGRQAEQTDMQLVCRWTRVGSIRMYIVCAFDRGVHLIVRSICLVFSFLVSQSRSTTWWLVFPALYTALVLRLCVCCCSPGLQGQPSRATCSGEY
jgi:hypothetical protein